MSRQKDVAPDDRWLDWARRLQAIGQTGAQLTEGYYDKINYDNLLRVAAEIVAAHSTLAAPEVLEAFSAQPGYATVKVDVRGAVVRDGRILLVQERRDGKWCLPGGWADVGDKPSEMVAREVEEESGFIVRPSRIVGVYDANRTTQNLEFFHAYKVVFLCEIEGGEARISDETSAVEFYDFDTLPPLSWRRTDERHLQHVRACLEDACQGAFFD